MTPTAAAGARRADETWAFGAYTFEFRKAHRGIGILTVRGGKVGPLPFHMVCKGSRHAHQLTAEVAGTFDDGKLPNEGVFRMDALAKATLGELGIRERRIVVCRRIALR